MDVRYGRPPLRPSNTNLNPHSARNDSARFFILDVLNSFLDEHADQSHYLRMSATDRAEITWLNGNQAPEQRLLAFDSWIRRELAARLVWPADEAKKARLIEQCRVHLEGLVLELWRRGWYLDGKRLAAHLQTVLDNIGKYQRTGKVGDFWAYFKSCVNRYVGANAEEIQEEALRAGAHVGNVLAALGVKRAGHAGPTLPELIAQRRDEITHEKTLRQKLANARGAAKNSGDQLPLI